MMIVPLFLACSPDGNHAEKNLQLIESYVQAVENMDFEAMENYLADDYTGFGPSFGDSVSRDQAIANWQDNVENLYESIKYNRSRNIAVTIDSGPNQGEWVSNWAELDIVYKDGKGEVTILVNTIYLIEEGKIAKSLTFYNEADALRQLGYVVIHPNDL
jgi:ketosteroid isomerase-like protein